MTEYQYMRSQVDEFLADLRSDSSQFDQDYTLIKRFWFWASCGGMGDNVQPVNVYLQRFHTLGTWEQANILFGLVEDINKAAIEAAKRFVGLAREEDKREVRNEPDTDAGRDAQSALRAEQALEEVQGGR